MDHDYTHPERHYKGLIFAPNGEVPKEERCKKLKFKTPDGNMTHHELCWSCGWGTDNQIYSSYGSRIRIFHTRFNVGLWSIGSQWLIRDEPNDATLGNDYMTQQFLRNQPGLNVPLVKKMQRLSEPTDTIHFTLMSRAQGVTLESIWNDLSPEQVSGYKDQLADAIKQLRRLTAPGPQKVDGSPLDDPILGFCHKRRPPTCKKMGFTTDEWFENLEPTLRRGLSKIHKTKDPAVIEEKFRELKDNFPKAEPYVLTHGDLNLTNIIVKDDKIEAIIDWEWSGYMPWWAERFLSMQTPEHCGEIFEPLWADLCPEMDEDTFCKEIYVNVEKVKTAWERSDKEHPDSDNRWVRPGFCECQPYSGKIHWDAIGNQLEHQVLDDDGVAKQRLDFEAKVARMRL